MPTAFEVSKLATPYNCEADVQIGNTLIEFKAWSPNANDTDIGSMGEDLAFITVGGSSAFLTLANNSYSKQPNAYTQFLCYLQNINSMSELTYYFDKDLLNTKGQSNPEYYVRNMFRELFMRPQEQEQVFNIIWGNEGLRENLFPETIGQITQWLVDNKDRIKAEFADQISETSDEFYKFIKVK